MPKTKVRSVNKRLVFLGVALLLLAAFLWWTKVFNSPQNVFWGMLDNSLSTSSITRYVSENAGDSSTERYMRLQTGSTNAAQSLELTKQGSTIVTKETIGTPTVDYVRYARIQTDQKSANGKPVDYKS